VQSNPFFFVDFKSISIFLNLYSWIKNYYWGWSGRWTIHGPVFMKKSFFFTFFSILSPTFFFVFLFFVRVISKCFFKWKHKYKSTELDFFSQKKIILIIMKLATSAKICFWNQKNFFFEKMPKKICSKFSKKLLFLDKFDAKCKQMNQIS
jgi:hypothetical protein